MVDIKLVQIMNKFFILNQSRMRICVGLEMRAWQVCAVLIDQLQDLDTCNEKISCFFYFCIESKNKIKL